MAKRSVPDAIVDAFDAPDDADPEVADAERSAVNRIASVPADNIPAFEEEPESEGRSPWEGDVKLAATCAGVSGRPASTTGGARGAVKFEIDSTEAQRFFDAMGQTAFDLTFDKAHLGDGYSVTAVSGRPDADGDGRAFVSFSAPETSMKALGSLFTRGLIGKHGTLLCGTSQVTMNELLTTRAE